MGWLFRKKEDKAVFEKPKVEVPECNHVWKDFPWYVAANYYVNTHRQACELYEPYVCAKCKKRKDVLLDSRSWMPVSPEEGSMLCCGFKETYKDHIAERGVIEDLINDYQLVDRTELEILEFLHGNLNGSKDIFLSITHNDGTETKVKVG